MVKEIEITGNLEMLYYTLIESHPDIALTKSGMYQLAFLLTLANNGVIYIDTEEKKKFLKKYRISKEYFGNRMLEFKKHGIIENIGYREYRVLYDLELPKDTKTLIIKYEGRS